MLAQWSLDPLLCCCKEWIGQFLSLEDAVVLLREAEEERSEADSKLKIILEKMGLGL